MQVQQVERIVVPLPDVLLLRDEDAVAVDRLRDSLDARELDCRISTGSFSERAGRDELSSERARTADSLANRSHPRSSRTSRAVSTLGT